MKVTPAWTHCTCSDVQYVCTKSQLLQVTLLITQHKAGAVTLIIATLPRSWDRLHWRQPVLSFVLTQFQSSKQHSKAC